jgi:hypothetical protein
MDLVETRIIRSIARQEYPRIELVLVGEECSHLEDLASRISRSFPGLPKRWINVPRLETGNSYPWSLAGRCRNRGVQLARGEFISCQDDDNELESDFASTLLSCLLAANADAAWCHRRWVMPNGSPYPGTFFPWAEPGTIRERLIFEMWRHAGVLTPGSDIVRDQLLAVHNSEVFSTVDANEWLVRGEFLRQFPYRERYGFYDLMANAAYDDLWNLEIRAAGARAVCSERVSLLYHLGGASNSSAIPGWLALQS